MIVVKAIKIIKENIDSRFRGNDIRGSGNDRGRGTMHRAHDNQKIIT